MSSLYFYEFPDLRKGEHTVTEYVDGEIIKQTEDYYLIACTKEIVTYENLDND